LVEVHVAAEAPGITGWRRCRPESWRDGDAAEHRSNRHREILQMVRRVLGHREPALPGQVPAGGLEAVLPLYGELPAERAPDDPVVAGRPVPIQADASETDREHVAWHRRLDVERTGLRIAAEHARDAMLIDTSSVHGRGVHRVAGPDVQHRRDR